MRKGIVSDNFFENEVGDDYRWRIGIHKGKKISEIPDDYLIWAYNNLDLRVNIRNYIERWIINKSKQIK